MRIKKSEIEKWPQELLDYLQFERVDITADVVRTGLARLLGKERWLHVMEELRAAPTFDDALMQAEHAAIGFLAEMVFEPKEDGTPDFAPLVHETTGEFVGFLVKGQLRKEPHRITSDTGDPREIGAKLAFEIAREAGQLELKHLAEVELIREDTEEDMTLYPTRLPKCPRGKR